MCSMFPSGEVTHPLEAASKHKKSKSRLQLEPASASRCEAASRPTVGHSPITRSLSAPTTTSCSSAENRSFPELDLTSNIFPRALNPVDPEPNTERHKQTLTWNPAESHRLSLCVHSEELHAVLRWFGWSCYARSRCVSLGIQVMPRGESGSCDDINIYI